MVNVYVDSKDEKVEEEEIKEETVEKEEKCDCEEETTETEEESCDCEEEAKEETAEDFDYKAYGKDTVNETKSMAEKMINDVVSTLKSKQSDWNKTFEEYKANKPSVDLLEYEDELVIKVDLPRVAKEDIDVKMSTESVDIEAIFPDELAEDEDVKVLRKERCSGKTKNVVLLPVEVDINEVKASFEDYVLTIKLPKIHGKKVDVEIV